MRSNPIISAEYRPETGTGAARAARRAGFVPGVVYGNNQDPETISVNPKDLVREYHRTGFFARLFTLMIDGKEQSVLAKDIQIHPVSDDPVHVDFQRVSEDERINVHVPITFINDDRCPGIKAGGKLNIAHHRLEVVCPVIAIPETFVVDLSGVTAGTGVHIADLNLPEGVVAAHPERDNTLATIVGGSAE